VPDYLTRKDCPGLLGRGCGFTMRNSQELCDTCELDRKEQESRMDGTATADKQEANVKVERFTRSLRIALTTEEVAQRADRAAHVLVMRDQKEAERKAANTAAKSQIEELDAELRRISGEIRDKAKFDTVNCERRFMYRVGRIVEVRLDTKEEIHESAMTLEERQLEMDLERSEGDAEDPADDGEGGNDDAIIEDEEADRIKASQKHPPLATEKRKAARRAPARKKARS
jgi:hypothetical protein